MGTKTTGVDIGLYSESVIIKINIVINKPIKFIDHECIVVGYILLLIFNNKQPGF